MVDRETRFARAVRAKKPPSSTSFALQEWKAAFADGPATADDGRLFEAADWIGAEMARLSVALPNQTLASLSPKWSTILAVAALNREYRTAVELGKQKAEAAAVNGTMALDALTGLRIPGAAGQEFTVGDFTEAGIDLAENWLFDAARSSGAAGASIADLAPTAVRAMELYSFRKSLNALWNQAWFRGWHVQVGIKGACRWIPGDEARERLEFAWRTRHAANLMNFQHIDAATWPHLTPVERRKRARRFSVVEVRETKERLELKVGAIGYFSKLLPVYLIERGALEGSYVADFIDSPLPIDSRLSVVLLLQAWHVLLDLARLLAARAPLPTTLSPGEACKLAMAVDRTTLARALAKALQVAPEVADAVIAFLTFAFQTGGSKKARGNKGLWAAPLVPVPASDEQQLLLPLPVLATSNPARRAEAWLEKGGIHDANPVDARGDRYEAIYRSKVCNAVASNKTFKTARCAADGIPMTLGFDEQIDLVVAFGGLCLVGEVKFFLMPADPHECERFDVKLATAAGQARRKEAALRARPDVLAHALGIDVVEASSLKLLPLVVTNQDYGFSTRVDSVLVVEAAFLRTYLASGEIVTDMVISAVGKRSITGAMTLYGTEQSAARRFETQMSAPYVLTRFLKRIAWKETPLPTLANGPTLLAMPVLEDIAGSDRMRVEALAGGLFG